MSIAKLLNESKAYIHNINNEDVYIMFFIWK
jgi:hypothetical protein